MDSVHLRTCAGTSVSDPRTKPQRRHRPEGSSGSWGRSPRGHRLCDILRGRHLAAFGLLHAGDRLLGKTRIGVREPCAHPGRVSSMRPRAGRAGGTTKMTSDHFNCLGSFRDAKPDYCSELTFMKADGHELLGVFRHRRSGTLAVGHRSCMPANLHPSRMSSTTITLLRLRSPGIPSSPSSTLSPTKSSPWQPSLPPLAPTLAEGIRVRRQIEDVSPAKRLFSSYVSHVLSSIMAPAFGWKSLFSRHFHPYGAASHIRPPRPALIVSR